MSMGFVRGGLVFIITSILLTSLLLGSLFLTLSLSLKYNNFQDERNIYNRNVFIVSGIIGIIIIIVGAVLHLTSVSSGLFGGGVLTIIYGTMNYWSELGDIARFIILGIALGVLIYLGYKKFGKKE